MKWLVRDHNVFSQYDHIHIEREYANIKIIFFYYLQTFLDGLGNFFVEARCTWNFSRTRNILNFPLFQFSITAYQSEIFIYKWNTSWSSWSILGNEKCMFEYWLGRDILSPLTWENDILKQTIRHWGGLSWLLLLFVLLCGHQTSGPGLTDGGSQLKDTRRLSVYQIFTSWGSWDNSQYSQYYAISFFQTSVKN